MPMTQDDIRRHYETQWRPPEDPADADALRSRLSYSSPVEDAVLGPAYERLVADLGIRVDRGRVLDVGCGSGRWVRMLLDRWTPREILGVDFTHASVELLRAWAASRDGADPPGAALRFEVADLTDPGLPPLGAFDLVNVGNVLFHVPEPEKFAAALVNLRRHLAPGGRIVTTEYMPRTRMRTEWMLVRSRYEMEAACAAAGLRIVDVRPTSFFANDPMGLDGPDEAVRGHFHRVRAGMQALLSAGTDESVRRFMIEFLADVERATLAYCAERIAPVDLPSQKLVVLAAD